MDWKTEIKEISNNVFKIKMILSLGIEIEKTGLDMEMMKKEMESDMIKKVNEAKGIKKQP